MKTSCTEELDQFTAGTGAFDVSHILNGISDLALNGAKRQAGISLERESRQAIQGVSGRAGVKGGDRAGVAGVQSLQQIRRRRRALPRR